MISRNAEETREFAARLARALARSFAAGELRSALVGLTGELGAGKTELVRGFVEALDPAAARGVSSPSFALVQHYPTVPPVAHLDLYRLGSFAELEAIGWRELYFGPGIALVEWIERVPEALPRDWLEIHLAVLPSDVREIAALPHGAAFERVARELIG